MKSIDENLRFYKIIRDFIREAADDSGVEVDVNTSCTAIVFFYTTYSDSIKDHKTIEAYMKTHIFTSYIDMMKTWKTVQCASYSEPEALFKCCLAKYNEIQVNEVDKLKENLESAYKVCRITR